MKSAVTDVLTGATTVALIVIATRWVFKSDTSDSPRTEADAQVYPIKRNLRVIAYCAAAFFVAVGLFAHDGKWIVDSAFVVAGVLCIWFVTANVKANDSGISINSLWRSKSIRWEEISEVRLHERDGGAIEVSSGAKKLVIDSRFSAHSHLLKEIGIRTNLQPTRD